MTLDILIRGLYVIIDTRLVRGDIGKIAEEVIAGGANLLQLRAKDLSTREFIEAGTRLNRICKRNRIPFIVNDRVDIALALDSDGIHLGQDDMPVSSARKIVPRGKLIGLSVHSLEEAAKAKEEKPDYIGVGPVFFTRTKESAIPPVGTELIRKIKREIDLPLVAIGGINAENMEEVIAAGADAAAVCSAILSADNIKAATEKLGSGVEASSPRPNPPGGMKPPLRKKAS
jgi:thiamine-phosphate pyrophosphorylase